MITHEVLIILVLILINGFFAMAELALVSARKSKLQIDSSQGQRRARIALELANSPKRVLSTVQVGITLIGVATSIYGGVRIADDLHTYLSRFPWLAEFSWPLSYGAVVVIITYLTLVIGELFPKRLALAYPERSAKIVGPTLALMAKIFRPLVAVLTGSADFLERIFFVRGERDHSGLEDEIRLMLSRGAEIGVIEKAEENIVSKAFRLDDRPAASIMTPRAEIEWVDVNDPLEEIWQEVSQSDRSHFLLCEGDVEKVIGIVSLKDISQLMLSPQGGEIRTHAMEPIRVDANMTALRVLGLFKSEKKHIALVFDEFGGLDGLITTHDLMEALVGTLSDSPDEEPSYQRRSDGSLLVDAGMDIDELFGLLEIAPLLHDDHRGYHSVGGFVMKQLGHIPLQGESFDFAGSKFEIVDMDRHRVDKVLVSPAGGSGESQ